jgi:hypothetical protein
MFGRKNFRRQFWSRLLSDPRGFASYFHDLLHGAMPEISPAENGHGGHHWHNRHIHSGMRGGYSPHIRHGMPVRDFSPNKDKEGEKREEKAARCPLCGNACSADSLRCGRGEEFFGS